MYVLISPVLSEQAGKPVYYETVNLFSGLPSHHRFTFEKSSARRFVSGDQAQDYASGVLNGFSDMRDAQFEPMEIVAPALEFVSAVTTHAHQRSGSDAFKQGLELQRFLKDVTPEQFEEFARAYRERFPEVFEAAKELDVSQITPASRLAKLAMQVDELTAQLKRERRAHGSTATQLREARELLNQVNQELAAMGDEVHRLRWDNAKLHRGRVEQLAQGRDEEYFNFFSEDKNDE